MSRIDLESGYVFDTDLMPSFYEISTHKVGETEKGESVKSFSEKLRSHDEIEGKRSLWKVERVWVLYFLCLLPSLKLTAKASENGWLEYFQRHLKLVVLGSYYPFP